MIDLSICVLHYNRWDLTKDCLASIDAQEVPCTVEKLVVDNGSERPLALTAPWQVVRLAHNVGHIAGQNRCFEAAHGAWVLFVANDVRLEPPVAITRLWQTACTSDMTLGQIQPQLLTPRGSIDQIGMNWKWPGYGISRTTLTTIFTTIVPSTCYLMKKAVWQELGGFNEQLLTSHEDVDMGLRLTTKRYLNVVSPTSLGLHLGNATLRDQSSHTRTAFHHDRLSVLRKHYRGLDYWSRYLAVQLLDHLPRWHRCNTPRSPGNPDTA